jgi:hypothetical protein
MAIIPPPPGKISGKNKIFAENGSEIIALPA